MATAGELGSRVSARGGAALLIDYGRNRPYPASLQAIRQHKFCGLLEQPGHADLSAHVDFSAIRYGCFCKCVFQNNCSDHRSVHVAAEHVWGMPLAGCTGEYEMGERKLCKPHSRLVQLLYTG